MAGGVARTDVTTVAKRSRSGCPSGGGAATTVTRLAWLAPAAAIFASGWGSNQFTPLLLVYRRADDLGTEVLSALFGVYALGLLPGLLLAGAISDARGRRAVVIPAAAISLLGSVALIAGAQGGLLPLFVGRLLIGLGTGAAFSAATAWLRELSARGGAGDDTPQTAARRTAIAMTSGFAIGPLVAGMLAQFAPAERVVPYLPHIVLMAVVLLALRRTPETVAPTRGRTLWPSLTGMRDARFRALVAPAAPWVFTAPAVAFALLPSLVGAASAAQGIALTAAITCLCALTGVLVQPLARRLGGVQATIPGLLVLAAGLVLAAVTARAGDIWLLVPCAIVLGGAYGLLLVGGLGEVQRLADAGSLGGMTATYYVLAYLGFAAPLAISLATRLAGPPTLLAIAAALALATAALVARRLAAAHTPATTTSTNAVQR